MHETPSTSTPYHPWRHLHQAWRHVNVEHVDDIAGDRLGETNGSDLIRLRRRQLQVERRCTLAHELIHLERGDEGECPVPLEADIDREAARRLIPWRDLLQAVRWARGMDELADELWVSPKILHARTAALHADELLEIARAFHDAHHSMPPEEEP